MGIGGEQGVIGYRIVSIDNGSPMSKLGIEPMLNFVLYSDQDPPFNEFIAEHENRQVKLTIFNIVTREAKKVAVIPKKWNGPGLLGATFRRENHLTAHLRTFRILHFYVDGPMFKAGLKTKKDYILGNSDVVLKNLEEFIKYISEHEKELLEFYVYNSGEMRVRKVVLRPDKEWGGPGLLGGDIGFGGEHIIPFNIPKNNINNENEANKEEAIIDKENVKETLSEVKKEDES